jgi:hypothetical protein
MASSAGRAKRDREKARQEKQAIKRERRQGAGETDTVDDDAPTVPSRPQDQVLADLAALHQRFDDEQISFDDFEDAKAGLLAELQLG